MIKIQEIETYLNKPHCLTIACNRPEKPLLFFLPIQWLIGYAGRYPTRVIDNTEHGNFFKVCSDSIVIIGFI